MDLVEKVGFDESFSFVYSPRPNTPAAEMEDNVTLEVKKERLTILQHKLNELSSKISRKMVGTIENCLVLGVSKKNVPYFVYYDEDAYGYRTASGNWTMRSRVA